MANTKLKGNLILLITAVVWGISFVSQRSGMSYVKPFTFNGIRTMLGALVLIPVLIITGRKKPVGEIKTKNKKTLIKAGILCGVLLGAASTIQTYGMVYTTAGKAGFITALYLIIVPVLGIFMKKKIRPLVWGCVALATVGMYFLCVNGTLDINKGDLIVLCCSFIFALHILTVDKYAGEVEGVKLAFLQFFVAGLLNIILMFIFDNPDFGAVWQCRTEILYSGIMSCGVAYTLQIIGQKYTDPTSASLIMSMESVFSVLAGWMLLHEKLTANEIFGCILVFAAIMIVQMPEKSLKTNSLAK